MPINEFPAQKKEPHFALSKSQALLFATVCQRKAAERFDRMWNGMIPTTKISQDLAADYYMQARMWMLVAETL